ncbi:hypothetical protein EBH_0014040 [Eimeria brunetti]|uniref:Retrotransposon gag domain-containing protein n=1 Tax=Eimeria brunetti TaxID=51314 RepID=U6L967_9EIME|nr:hypothetical protein EBH_0014040 [Eimeria brunetti]
MEQEIAELRRQMAVQMTMGQRPAPRRPIAYEDGRNMRNFLDLVELEFFDLGIGTRQWGEELSRYLKDDALDYWLYLRRTGTPLTDWDLVRQRFCGRFCSMPQEKMIELMAKNVWKGNPNAYSARFAAIVAQGVTMTPDQLVGFYLANLPEEQYQAITQGGTRKFTEWQEAATELPASEVPSKAMNEERLRYQQQLADARRRAGKGGRKCNPRQELARRGNLREDNTEARCYECRGKGHLSGRRLQVVTRAWWPPGVTPSQSPPAGGSEKWNMSEEDSRHAPLTSEEPPVPTRTREEQSGSDTGRCEDSARKRTQEATQRDEDEGVPDLPWWTEGTPLELAHEGYGSLCGTGKTAVLKLEIAGYECEGLLGTEASRGFIRPATVERLGLRVRFLPKACTFTVANGEVLHIDHTVTRLSMICGGGALRETSQWTSSLRRYPGVRLSY